MAELDSSLTAMDWLPQLGVGGPMSSPSADDSLKPRFALRQVPGSTLDTTATLDQQQAKMHQGKNKPPYSYANLITFAINSTAKKKMTLNEIYNWICKNFPYYRDAGNGWKVRDIISNTYVLHPTILGIVDVFGCHKPQADISKVIFTLTLYRAASIVLDLCLDKVLYLILFIIEKAGDFHPLL